MTLLSMFLWFHVHCASIKSITTIYVFSVTGFVFKCLKCKIQVKVLYVPVVSGK